MWPPHQYLTCQKCNGVGTHGAPSSRSSPKITLDDDKDDSGYHKCTFCKGSGGGLQKCAAKGWVYLPLINVRSFSLTRCSRTITGTGTSRSPAKDYELKFQKNKFTEMLDAGDAEKKRQEEEAESRKRGEESTQGGQGRKSEEGQGQEGQEGQGREGQEEKEEGCRVRSQPPCINMRYFQSPRSDPLG